MPDMALKKMPDGFDLRFFCVLHFIDHLLLRMTTYYIHPANNLDLFLDVLPSTKGKGQNVIIDTFTGQKSQLWTIDLTNGVFKNVETGLLLDIGSREGCKAGNDIILWHDYHGANQRWKWDPNTKGIVAKNKLALGIRGKVCQGAKCCALGWNDAPQKWVIFRSDTNQEIEDPSSLERFGLKSR